MEFRYLSIGLSLLLGIAYLYYLRYESDQERRPIRRMAVAAVLGGLAATAAAVLLYDAGHAAGIGEYRTVAGAFFFVGPVEELAKIAGFLMIWLQVDKDMRGPRAAVVYMGCVALGFSLYENWTYANQGADNRLLLIIRLIISTPMHISFSAVCGYVLFFILRGRAAWYHILWAFIWAAFMHGLYDAVLIASLSPAAIAAVFLISKMQMRYLLKRRRKARAQTHDA
jgi:RsiW-degrading membrane proteinase PrsW (M82 family)